MKRLLLVLLLAVASAAGAFASDWVDLGGGQWRLSFTVNEANKAKFEQIRKYYNWENGTNRDASNFLLVVVALDKVNQLWQRTYYEIVLYHLSWVVGDVTDDPEENAMNAVIPE